MFAPSVQFVLILALLSGQALASAVKGHSSISQQPQRAVEQAPVKSPSLKQEQLQQAPIKSPVQQQEQLAERQPKAASALPAQPILESSKKVYNDESIRRSAANQQQLVNAEPAAKSAPVIVAPVEPVASPVASPIVAPVVVPAAAPVKPVEPVVAPIVPAASAPVVSVVHKEPVVVEAKKVEQIEAKSEQPAKVVEPVVKIDKDELPAQSMRSVPIKDEPSRVIVEQVVPAKLVEQQQAPVASPIVAPAPIQDIPIKPVVVEQPVVQSAPIVPAPVVVAAVGQESLLQAKKDEQSPVSKVEAEPAPIEVPAPDPGLVLSEPIDSTTKLLIDLDEHVQKFLPAEDKQDPAAPTKEQVLVPGVDYSPAEQPSGKSNAPLVPYSSVGQEEPIVPPLPQSIDKVEKASGAVAGAAAASAASVQSNTRQASSSSSHHGQHQNQQQVITQLLDQLDTLQNRIQDTINQLVARRRYVMSALLRPMGTYVRRVRTNLERLQNRVNQLQAAAVSVGGNQNGQRPGGFVDAAAIETIRRRIDDISKRISDIVNRIRFSLTPTSAPLNNNGK